MGTSSALEAANAFSSGKTDLAVVPSDVGDLSQAEAVILVAHAVALLVASPGSSITDITDLKRFLVGVIGGETNRKIMRRPRGLRSARNVVRPTQKSASRSDRKDERS
jgi:hypothetical protein